MKTECWLCPEYPIESAIYFSLSDGPDWRFRLTETQEFVVSSAPYASQKHSETISCYIETAEASNVIR